MELNAGLKKTDVGVIPVDWATKACAHLVDSTAPIRYGVVQVGKHTDNGIPIVAIKYVKEVAHAPLHRTSVDLEKRYIGSRVKTGDVLISIKGTIGRVGIVPNGFDGNISRELARLRIQDKFSPAYIAHQLENGNTQERINRAVVGTTRLEFSIAALREFKIPLPPTRAEQDAIAEVLNDADSLIESIQKLIIKKSHIKQGAMQELLTGKKRLPGFNGEWKSSPLGKLASLYQSVTISQAVFSPDGYPVYGANGIIGRYDNYNHDTWQITISCRGNCGTVNKTEEKSWITGNAMVVNCDGNEKIDKLFLYYLLCSQDFSILVTGSGQPQIVRGPLSEFEISFPTDVIEQAAIAEILTDIDSECSALETKLTKARRIKQGMMQQLLTGRIRLV